MHVNHILWTTSTKSLSNISRFLNSYIDIMTEAAAFIAINTVILGTSYRKVAGKYRHDSSDSFSIHCIHTVVSQVNSIEF